MFCHPITNCYHRKHIELQDNIPESMKNMDLSHNNEAITTGAVAATPAPRRSAAAITPMMDLMSAGLSLTTPAPARGGRDTATTGTSIPSDVPTGSHTHGEGSSLHTPSGDKDAMERSNQVEIFESTYFIGLTFCNGLRTVDLTVAIQVLLLIS